MRNVAVRFWRIVSSQRSSGSSHTGTSSAGQTPATAAQTSTEPSSARAAAKSRSTSASTREVGLGRGGASDLRRERGGALGAAVVVDEHLGALGGEGTGTRAADAPGGTGDDDALSCKPGRMRCRRLSGVRSDDRLAGVGAARGRAPGRHLRDLFAADPGRAERFTGEAAGLFLDFSKNRVTDETMRLLVALAEERGVAERRDAMFAGEHINVTEDRAVLHVALRMPRDRSLVVDGVDVVAEVHEVLDRMVGVRRRGAHAASGGAPRAARSGTSSTSASAAPTSGP